MKHFVENITGNILGYDSVEQADYITKLDLTKYTEITTLPKEFDVWDSTSKTFKVDTAAKTLAASVQYRTDRVYPSIQDQLDMQYHDALNGTTTWKDAITAEKLRVPKPV